MDTDEHGVRAGRRQSLTGHWEIYDIRYTILKQEGTEGTGGRAKIQDQPCKCTPLTYNQTVVFIETPIFTKRIQQHMDDAEYLELQKYLAARPDAGDIIKGSGGMRKMRWAGSGRGKRGGLRVIYYWWIADDQISMLLVYPKNEMDDLTADQLKQLKNVLIK
jgi:hypothetical protein